MRSTYPGGSVEHWNEEAGAVWMDRLTNIYEHVVWLNPVPQEHWGYSPSTELLKQLVSDRMYPMTLGGLDEAMRELRPLGNMGKRIVMPKPVNINDLDWGDFGQGERFWQPAQRPDG